MPIFDQGYQHWHGELTGLPGRWMAIVRQGVITQWRKSRYTRWVVVGAVFPALVLWLLLIAWSLFEQKSAILLPFLPLIQGLPEELKAGPRNFRVPIWTLLFHRFLEIELFVTMLLVLLVGPDLISQDLRFNALPLYFSRPLRRVDYFLGKFGVIAAYLCAVTMMPVVVAYVLGVGFSLDYKIVGETFGILLGSLAYGAIVVASASTLMLAFSSLSKNSRVVGGMWLGMWFLGNLAERVLTLTVKAPWCPLVAYTRNFGRLCEELLDTRAAWEPIMKLFPPRVASRALEAANRLYDFPWQWSALVLAVLFGLSLWVLSMRVRTLDRLR